jgi:hypothetical protein
LWIRRIRRRGSGASLSRLGQHAGNGGLVRCVLGRRGALDFHRSDGTKVLRLSTCDVWLRRVWRLRATGLAACIGRRGSFNPTFGGLSVNAQEKVSSIAAAISGHGGEVFPVPLHDELGAHGNGRFEADAGTGRRCVFEGGGCVVGESGRVLPEHLCHCPQRRPRFDDRAVHAMCIGGVGQEFSYGRLRMWLQASRSEGSKRHCSQDGAG